MRRVPSVAPLGLQVGTVNVHYKKKIFVYNEQVKAPFWIVEVIAPIQNATYLVLPVKYALLIRCMGHTR